MGQPTTEDSDVQDVEDHPMFHIVSAASALLKTLLPGAAASVTEHRGRVRDLPPAMPPSTPPKIAARRDMVVYGWPHFGRVIMAVAFLILAIAVASVIVRM